MADDPTNVGEVLGGASSTVPNPYGELQTIIYIKLLYMGEFT